MNSILEFAQNNFIIFLVIEIILIFSLIGFIVEKNRDKDLKVKKEKNDNTTVETL